MELNNTLMRAIELQMEQQERLESFIRNEGPLPIDLSVRKFFESKFESSILASISAKLAFGFEQVTDGE